MASQQTTENAQGSGIAPAAKIERIVVVGGVVATRTNSSTAAKSTGPLWFWVRRAECLEFRPFSLGRPRPVSAVM